jgi:hypothetical protein
MPQETAPAWSQAVSEKAYVGRYPTDLSVTAKLFEMLAETQMRLNDLDARLPPPLSRENTDTFGADDEIAEAQARAALHNLLFPNLPMEIYGNPHTSHHLGSSRNPSATRTSADRADAARAVNVESLAEMPEWGSSVEIPDGESTVPPPQFSPALPPKASRSMPVIHIQPPTTTATNSQGGTQREQAHTAPATHEQDDAPLNDVTVSVAEKERAKSVAKAPLSVKSMCQPPVYHEKAQQSQQSKPSLVVQVKPWDIVNQRLLSWALVWPAEDFIRSLEAIALGHQVCILCGGSPKKSDVCTSVLQVDEFSLTIYTMTILKR